MNQRQRIKREKGITLVALIITIIVLVILAAVSINAAFNTGIIDTAVNGAVNYVEAQRQEQVTFDELDSNLQDILNRINEYDVGGGNNPTPVPDDEKQDGSWNGTKEMNSPKVTGTGLIPVYHNGTSWVDLTESSTKEEWANWYDYDTQKWANARTADGSMWVWIPRYEYKIDSTAKTIDVRFIKTDVKAGTAGYTTDSTTGIVTSSDDYIVHPAFMDDTANGYNNGGWDSEIEGFWVAKYAAGFQNGTIGEITAGASVKTSSINYNTSGGYTNYYGSITNDSTPISYPVFKANTYAYNMITVGDAYRITQEIKNAKDMYGINSTVDSHLEKNSEWGAVAYLTHSKYGLDANSTNLKEVTMNSKNMNNDVYVNGETKGTKANIYAVTSYGKSGTANDVVASSTANMSGVFDLRGCVWEYIPEFLSGVNPPCAQGITIENSKYVTVYTSNERKSGDATKETEGWNNDCGSFVDLSYPVFIRGGFYGNTESSSGVFAFHISDGSSISYHGFRAVLIPN